MKKFGLFLLASFVILGVVIVSCTKTVKIPVSYSVMSDHDTFVRDIYVPDSGIFNMDIAVSFLTGTETDSVTLTVDGLPAGISVSPTTFSGIPSYVKDFVLTTHNAAHGTYRAAIVASAPDEQQQAYYFNITVISADCATPLIATLTGHNACSATNYTYTATGTASGTANTLIVNNFGGYGTNTNTTVVLNCENDSLTVPSQNIGNGAIVQGYGTFTATGMVVYYTASSLPGGGTDACTATFTE